MPNKKAKALIVGAIGVGVIALIVKNKKSLKAKPDLFIRDSIPGNYNAITVPPFGIFVRSDQQGNAALLQHELIHWRQYQRMGLTNYYATYFAQLVRDGYDKMPMEIEARANESDFCKTNYTECVRNGSARTVSDKNFRS